MTNEESPALTNAELIVLAAEANSIAKALDHGCPGSPEQNELLERLYDLLGQASSDPEELLLAFAIKMLSGERFVGVSTKPETRRRLESLAADMGARKEGPTVYAPPARN
jgi:hypothetical protein